MSRCEHTRAVADAAPGTLSPALQAHARHCVECAEELALTSALARIGDRGDALEADRGPSLRDAVLARVAAEKRSGGGVIGAVRRFTGGEWTSGTRIAAGALAAAAAAAAVVVVLRAPPPATPVAAPLMATTSAAPAPAPAPVVARAEPMRAAVAADQGAVFTHGREQGDERVKLDAGRIHLEVAHLDAGERFRVLTDDAEVEVRGTSFEVVAVERKLVSVKVESGVVDVRPSGRAPVTLTRGESWSAEEKRAPAVKRAAARTFDDAWSAMRAADYVRAGELFASAEKDGSALPEDAAYGRAIALARAGKRDEAIAAMTSFVTRYPGAPKRSSVAVALGWLLVDAGRPAEAEPHFASAKDDPAEPIRASARHGLATIAGR